jgi:hypothetical protein
MRNQPFERDLSLSAGWLYADILIALAVLFLVATASARGVGSSGANGAGATTSTTRPRSGAGAGLTSRVTTTVPPTTLPPTTTTIPVGIASEPIELEVRVDVADLLAAAPDQVDRLVTSVGAAIDRAIGARRVGFVLAFGVDPKVGRGQVIAARFNTLVLRRLGHGLDTATLRNFDYRATEGAGTIRLELYVFNE